MGERTGKLARPNGKGLAWRRLSGREPTVVFLPGFGSDMSGEKATSLATFCSNVGQAMLRFDYSGHGESDGRFEEGTIGQWTDDALAVMDAVSAGPLLLVGSSMGGWIALLAALARPERVAGIVGIAAAPDFTEILMWQSMTFEERDRLMADGVVFAPNRYGPPTPITRALIEDGRTHLLLDRPIPLTCPVRLLHGQNDQDVPWELSLRIAERLESTDVHVILVKDGEHRLSRPADLALLHRTLAPLLGQDRG
jgi:pimeloyl-ACP methyl ester carboxylesterase